MRGKKREVADVSSPEWTQREGTQERPPAPVVTVATIDPSLKEMVEALVQQALAADQRRMEAGTAGGSNGENGDEGRTNPGEGMSLGIISQSLR